jgi:hypothetical protein
MECGVAERIGRDLGNHLNEKSPYRISTTTTLATARSEYALLGKLGCGVHGEAKTGRLPCKRRSRHPRRFVGKPPIWLRSKDRERLMRARRLFESATYSLAMPLPPEFE